MFVVITLLKKKKFALVVQADTLLLFSETMSLTPV